MESISISSSSGVLNNHNAVGVSVTLGWTRGGIDELELRLVGTVASCWHCFTAPGFVLNPTARFGLVMWKMVPTASVALFGIRVTSAILGIPDIDEGLLLSATFDGTLSSIDIGSVATGIDWLFLESDVSSLVMLVIRYTIGGVVMLLGFATDDEGEGRECNWSTRVIHVRHGENQRR